MIARSRAVLLFVLLLLSGCAAGGSPGWPARPETGSGGFGMGGAPAPGSAVGR